MRILKNGDAQLSSAERGLLVEALRRRFMADGSQTITERWTGLGCLGEYKPAVNAGLMTLIDNHHPRRGSMGWWKLTEKGARIVAYWIGQGCKSDHGTDVTPVPDGLIPWSVL